MLYKLTTITIPNNKMSNIAYISIKYRKYKIF